MKPTSALSTLSRYIRPAAPPPPDVCESCRGFAPEVMVPAPEGDGISMMCWLCAHQVADHDISIEGAVSATCQCSRDEIYPADVIEALGARVGERAVAMN